MIKLIVHSQELKERDGKEEGDAAILTGAICKLVGEAGTF